MEENFEEKTPKEQGEEKLAKMLKQHPKLKQYANFTTNENGEFVYEFQFDFKNFDIAFNDYFFLKNHPKDENAKFIDEFFESLYKEVLKRCKNSKEYTIDCWQNRYTVQKIEEIDVIHYNSLTPEEKSQYDENKINEQKQNISNICSNYIEGISWRVERYKTQKELEIETSDTPETYLQILEYMQYLRDYDKTGEWWIEEPKTFEDWRK